VSVFIHEDNQAYIYDARAGAMKFPIVEVHWLMWPHDR